MFVLSFKASKFRLLFAAVLCGVIALGAMVFLPETEHTVTVNGVQNDRKIHFDGMKSEEDLVQFAESIGFALESTPTESVKVKLPRKFDALLTAYNEIQKSQGFNLAKYRGKTVERYTFRVTGLPDEQALPEGEVLLTLIVYRSSIVGGDVYFTGESDGVGAFLK